MSRRKRKRIHSHQLSPAQRAFVRAFAAETALASRQLVEEAVRNALPEALSAAGDADGLGKPHTRRQRRRALRDMRGRFLGWE